MEFFLFILSILLYIFLPEWYIFNITSITSIQLGILLVLFLRSLGRQVVILEILPIMGIVFYLLAPALSYYLVDIQWYEGYTYMPIDATDYFELAIPGTLAIGLGIYFPMSNSISSEELIKEVIAYVKDREVVAVQLIVIGFTSFVLKGYVPNALALIFNFGSDLIMIGSLYLFFGAKKEKLALAIMGGFLLGIAISGGMFGELIVWAMMVIVFYFLKYKWHFFPKLFVMILGLFLILLIQSVKGEYRTLTWLGIEELEVLEESKAEIFSTLLIERIQNPSEHFTPATLSKILDRFNQGYLTASAVEYTPAIEPYAEGETILIATLGAFVPRLLWPNKPEAGGKANIDRFTNLQISEGTSMNIGQLGDAYVNFGKTGGAIFMFFYALFSKMLFNGQLLICRNRPTYIFWLPFLFSTVIMVETDVLLVFNHIIKGLIFIWLVIKGFELFTGKEL